MKKRSNGLLLGMVLIGIACFWLYQRNQAYLAHKARVESRMYNEIIVRKIAEGKKKIYLDEIFDDFSWDEIQSGKCQEASIFNGLDSGCTLEFEHSYAIDPISVIRPWSNESAFLLVNHEIKKARLVVLTKKEIYLSLDSASLQSSEIYNRYLNYNATQDFVEQKWKSLAKFFKPIKRTQRPYFVVIQNTIKGKHEREKSTRLIIRTESQ